MNSMNYDSRLAELNITLPEAPAPAGMYSPIVQVGDLLYLAGHIPTKARGKVGLTVTEQEANAAAEEVARLLLATIRNHLGTLDRVERIVKVFGLVNCTPEFTNIPQVINGFSQVMLNVFGEAGRAARSAVGAVSLPLGVPVEVEAVVQVRSEQQ
jgi:enamine deaminase RidA (YjgF/YER057c/UK114 family)